MFALLIAHILQTTLANILKPKSLSNSVANLYNSLAPNRTPSSSKICNARQLKMSSQKIATGNDAPGSRPKTVTYDGKQYKIAREGSAEILDLQRPEDAESSKNAAPKPQSVFYNPIQQYNRDLSVLAIKAFAEDYDVIRKYRQHRRLEQQGKGKQRGQKRKRERTEGAKEAEDPKGKKVNGGESIEPSERPSDGKVRENAEPSSVAEAGSTAAAPLNKDREQCLSKIDDQDKFDDNEMRDGGPKINNGTEAREDVLAPTQPAFRILDALSATGLRALRYAKEIPMATSITANDLEPSATNAIRLNVEHNKLVDKITPNISDAIQHMHHASALSRGGSGHYQVIDLDPYGTAAPFLDAAVRATVDGGLLCVTCTDAGVFASVGYLEKTYSQYGGLPIKGPHAHEGGLRLILHAIATTAARYGIAIEPLLSLSIDFYARIFVRVHRSPAEVKFLASKTMVVYGCDTGCGAWSTQHLAKAKAREAKNGDTIYSFTAGLAPSANTTCEHCGFKTHQAGPMWGGPLHNPHFIQRILDMLPTLDRTIYGTIPRIEGMLTTALNEFVDDVPTTKPASKASPNDRPIPPIDPAAVSHHPFFFLAPSLARVLHCVSPPDAAIRGALLHLGYRTTRSHTKGGSIVTDAPWKVIWEVMREWIRQKSPIKEGAIKENTAGWGIMQKDRANDLNTARQIVRDAVDGSQMQDLEGLKKEMEAALYRVSKIRQIAEQEASAGAKENGTAPVSDSGAISAEEPVIATENLVENDERTEKNEKRTRSRSPSRADLSKVKVVFDEALGKEPQGKKMVRYQANPRPDWGPMNRAKGGS